ncbi:putative N-acetylmannosamine-6-phosphate 2-epimerase [Enterovibrio sp. ZSDZ35]|uniref:N-acylglucosamine-6-phosphate 2-epimerase n=1 Tax=Enterovibrio qingdaonensis TaxID=2899818 RepID=A0ABT5QFZ6_9GAMM|nr:putative N-acetylmannosamine-6-phosphate 2-epimerase [Enterovibrio sp. ZSDZ35]MDD1779906.1 putative N-acetylmannosamine-6-phosphate 2-epimerase [Enterovibrio sp. ZSDZ35]
MNDFHIEAEPVIHALRGGLVVSCQPVENGPLDRDDIVVAYAQALSSSGARALRIEGVERVALVKEQTNIPVIGIVKRDLSSSEVRITPLEQDVIELAKAGADIIAIDGTLRKRPVPFSELVILAKALGVRVMADCSNFDEGIEAADLQCDLVGSTLSGYISGPTPTLPDVELVKSWVSAGIRVMAEGRYNQPDYVREALEAGAWSCTVGSAITRPEFVTQWFATQADKGFARFNRSKGEL